MDNKEDLETKAKPSSLIQFQAIGYIRSCFSEKNGTPRQGILCKNSKATLKLDFGTPNPHHSLEGLESCSHIYLIFLFHDNGSLENKKIKNKVSPPRLEGISKIGVFASRSPHHPNPIGLSIVKLDKIIEATLYLSGVDLIDGTPIIDIKPYIPEYDCIADAKAPNWITHPRPVLHISFTEEANGQLESLFKKCEFYETLEDTKSAIEDVLKLDPRSTYRKKKFVDEICGFCVDVLNIRCKFVKDEVLVIAVEDWSEKFHQQKKKLKKQKLNPKEEIK